MKDKTKKIIKWSGIGAVAVGSLAIYIGGGSEGYAIEVVGAVFAVVGIVMSLIKGGK